jgi:hypothetical protein
MFKKQNSLLKKKINYLHNLHPVFYRKNLKKKIKNIDTKSQKIKMFKKDNMLKYLLKKPNNLLTNNTLNGKKKLKKVILVNRKLYNFLNNYVFKVSKKLTKNISKKSKLRSMSNLLNLEYALSNVILNSNIIKSYQDLKALVLKKCIYLNRSIIKHLNIELSVGDIIEFYLSKKFFNYIFYFKHVVNKHIIKIRNGIWYKLRLKNKNLLDYKNNNLLNNVFKNNYLLKSFIPNYLEVDFYTLTISLIFKSLNFKNYSLNIKKILVVYLFKLYN